MGLDRVLFQGTVDPSFICGLCDQVLLNPVTAGCQHIFCQNCVRRKIKSRVSKPICPSCSARLKPNISQTSIEFKLQLLELRMSCSHNCGEVFALADLPDHADVCPNAPIECGFKAHGCKKTVKRCDLRRHHEECDFRLVECEACGYRTMYRDLFTHQSRVRCLEKKLKQQIIRERKVSSKEVNKHREKLFKDGIRLEQHQRQSLLRHSKSMSYLYDRRLSKRTESDSEFDFSPRDAVFVTERVINEETDENQDEHIDREFQTATRTPHSSRSGFALQICCQCERKFRMDTNHQSACRWHIGVQVFTCFACGRLDYQPGCASGFHRP